MEEKISNEINNLFSKPRLNSKKNKKNEKNNNNSEINDNDNNNNINEKK